MTIQLATADKDRIADGHDSAAVGLDALAESLPQNSSGGVAEGHLLAILAAVAGTAGDIAVINAVTREQIRQLGGDFAATDGDVAANFAALGVEVKQ